MTASLRDDPAAARRALDREHDRLVGLLEGEGSSAAAEDLQQQAGAQDVERRRRQTLARVDAARERVDSGEYGWCARCGEPIPEARLKLDPTVALCVACAGRD